VLLAVTTAIYSFESAPKTVESILDSFMDGSVKELFKVWHLVFKKTYTMDSSEARERYATFKAKVAEIKKVNSENLPYKLGLNEFSDMTYEEFSRIYLTYKLPTAPTPTPNFLEEEDDDLTKRNLEVGANEINHTQFFGPIRHQGNCGSCWSYAATGTVESAHAMKNGRVTPYLSVQQLVDCERTYSRGCQGGFPDKALLYVQTYGLMLDSYYPYTGYDGQCRYNNQATLYRTRGIRACNAQSTTPCSLNTLYSLLVSGPMTVVVWAGPAFESYRTGVFIGDCRGQQPNHAIILVGWGIDSTTGYQYWLIRNSWGTTWGMQGYGRIAVNEGNALSCFIQSQGYSPIL
jgi:C1A family cysteine protease